MRYSYVLPIVGAFLGFATLSACTKQSGDVAVSKRAADCMARAMYFESNRSSRDGMIAVGSVVMNRVKSDAYPGSVCGVVSQAGQFAPGVMTSRMSSSGLPLAQEAARSVLSGERHPMIANAEFFHAANYHAGYNNMHYVLVAGGNAFYEKRPPELVTQPTPPRPMVATTR
ncbi:MULTISPECIES: cell wall hydrolase [Roseobacteraceae]|uniref:cell wall hydrolase n=1 Tax=Aliiruegeria sabulilitoris TaxID=1510458 RepID=UPI000833825B|nr:cell wall hydrolase [Pseudoruegeria sp. M32A2M]